MSVSLGTVALFLVGFQYGCVWGCLRLCSHWERLKGKFIVISGTNAFDDTVVRLWATVPWAISLSCCGPDDRMRADFDEAPRYHCHRELALWTKVP